MKRSIAVRPESQADIKEAALWYEDQLAGLGTRFRNELRTTFGHIADNFLRFPVIEGNVRRALLHRFPYAVYFTTQSDSVVVIAVLHQHRRPSAWQSRR